MAIKRTVAVLAAALTLCGTALAQYVSLSGTLQSSNGMPASNYVLSFTPSQMGFVSGTGIVVNTSTYCATSTDGTVVGIPNPLLAPSVTTGFTGTLPPANYFVKIAFYDASGNLTLVSPETVIQLNSTGQLIVASPSSGMPAGSAGMKVYISTTTNAETLQGQSTGSAAFIQSVPLVTGAAVPSSNATICKQVANDAIWPVGTGYTVALTDPSGNTLPGYPMQWQLMGPNTTINLSNGLPYYHGTVFFPSPILASPLNHGLQSISGPLSLSGYNLSNVGTLGAAEVNTKLFNNILFADQYPGADAGAKINAADTALGANPGTIIYNAAAPASATTNVTLSANHKLVLQSPITWTAAITLTNNTSGQDISCPALQTLAYTAADTTWLYGTGVSNVSFHDCRFAGTVMSGPMTRGAIFTDSTGISVADNTASEALLVAFLSSASYTTCADGSQCQYPNVTTSNSSSNIRVSGNKGSATGTGSGAFVFLDYANQATVSANVASGYFDSVMWWGGDSCTSGCTAGQNGAFTNERKIKNLTIANNVFTGSSNACIWGSMGQFLTITGNTCVGKGANTDVGLDLEGTWDSTVSSNTVSGYLNGDLTTFWLSTRVAFVDNVVSQSNATYLLISAHNASNTPDGLTQSFTGNILNCTASTVCNTGFQSAEIYNIAGNHFHNTMLSLSGQNISQIFISGNDFTFDVAADHGIQAQTNSGSAMSPNGLMAIRNNVVLSSATQASGKAAILTSGADFNNPSNIRIENNRTDGTNAFPVDIECDAASLNSGVPTYCSLLDNILGTNSIVTNNATSGAPVHVQSVNNNTPANYQTFGFSGALSNSGSTFGVDASGNVTSVPIKATTGARYVCVDTNGKLISQAAACSGT